MTATDDELLARWRDVFAAPVAGWDFSEFAGRIIESSPPWSYEEIVRDALEGASSAVDLGTGGGEFMLSLADALPADMHATEGWPPNVPVARAALEPLGIPLAEYDADRGDDLPYDDERFDVVLDRHEAYSAAEVHRVLRAGGVFVTQQVTDHLADLSAAFGMSLPFQHVTLAHLRHEAEAAGLAVVRAEEWSGPIRFADADTLVAYLRWVPWQLPDDFTVDRYADTLLDLHHRAGDLAFTSGRFVLVCRRTVGG